MKIYDYGDPTLLGPLKTSKEEYTYLLSILVPVIYILNMDKYIIDIEPNCTERNAVGFLYFGDNVAKYEDEIVEDLKYLKDTFKIISDHPRGPRGTWLRYEN